jgi:transcriptional regulator with XRE-family HTH domain
MPASLGTFIRERRLELGLTQEELAARVGLTTRQAEISRLEQGRIALPRRERLEAIAAALDVSLGELLVRTGWMTEGDRLAAAVLNVESLTTSDEGYPQGLADLAEVVADVQAMLVEATQTIEQAARTLAHAQAQQALWLTGQPGTEDGAVSPDQGRDAARNARVDRVQVVGHGHPNGHDSGRTPARVTRRR